MNNITVLDVSIFIVGIGSILYPMIEKAIFMSINKKDEPTILSDFISIIPYIVGIYYAVAIFNKSILIMIATIIGMVYLSYMQILRIVRKKKGASRSGLGI